MTTDFTNFEELNVSKGATAEFPLDMLAGKMSLTLSPATEANMKYFNQLLKKSRSKMKQISSKKLDVNILGDNRNEDRELYAKYIIIGWKVNDAKGKPVKFTTENVEQFLNALPNWIFDNVRAFASSPESFIDLEIDPEETAGN